MRASIQGFVLGFVMLVACETPTEAPPDAGATDPCAACLETERCDDGMCVNICDCADDERCDDSGRCTPVCRTDASCDLGHRCEAGACIPGCSGDERCPDGAICEQGECRSRQCSDINDCGSGQRCLDERCIHHGEASCTNDGDCGKEWSCSSYGLCFEGECLVHDDCDASQRCRSGRCLSRMNPPLGVQFERRFVPPVTDHLSREPLGAFRGYGLGGALFDFDGDHDLDLFVGYRQRLLERDDESAPCVYENVSIPGNLRFRPAENFCGFDLGHVSSGFGLDVEGDGYSELLALGEGFLQLWRFHPEIEVIDLNARLAEDDPRKECNAGAVSTMDLNFDGRSDLIIGCQMQSLDMDDMPDRDSIWHIPVLQNQVFLQTESGDFTLTNDPTLIARQGDRYGLEDDGSGLGLGPIDIDRDGLLDLVVANDTFSSVNSGADHMPLPPGGVYFRCGPAEDCTWTWRGLGPGYEAWGSFMGLGNVHIEGLGDHIYVADLGPNRATRYDNRRPIDVGRTLGIDIGYSGDYELFAWGVVIEDFDRDGRDDIYVSNGSVPSPRVGIFEAHYDGFFLQEPGGSFASIRPEEVGLSLHDQIDAPGSDWVYASRGAVKADLDNDGFVEILTLPMEGYIRIHSEVPTRADVPPRCTIVPKPRYVPAYGFGYEVASAQENDWRRRDMQGQLRFGASPYILSTENRGRFKFPSGAIVDFDCLGGAGPVIAEEPEWIRFLYQEDVTKLRLTTQWTGRGIPQLRVLFDSPTGAREVGTFHDGVGWDLTPRADEHRLMLKVDGRWLPRWFPTRQEP
ncbi:MAG: VCBS repeat-containing protein [Myxococcota bacterium]|nr:VCBS repeat-containing protein [Myxococcota bacterium]